MLPLTGEDGPWTNTPPQKLGTVTLSVTPDAELRIQADLRNSVASQSSPKLASVGVLSQK